MVNPAPMFGSDSEFLYELCLLSRRFEANLPSSAWPDQRMRGRQALEDSVIDDQKFHIGENPPKSGNSVHDGTYV